jgi:PEP-CTERM motif
MSEAGGIPEIAKVLHMCCRMSCSFNVGIVERYVQVILRVILKLERAMRKSLLIVAAILLVSCTSAFADSVTYTVTGAGNKFDLSFTEPTTLTSLDTFVPVTFTATGKTINNAEVTFFDDADSGLFEVTFENKKGVTKIISFIGPQMFTGDGPFELLGGVFDIDGGAIFKDGKLGKFFEGTPATVVTGKLKVMPEPSSVLMLMLGLAGVLALRKKQLA